MFSRILLLSLVSISVSVHSYAQEIVVTGHFLKDSVKIGEQIPYTLTVRYPSTLTVVFPDSTFSFAPFEMEKKIYFPTRTKNQISFDSAVYYLNTFEIDSLQSLALPVFVVQAGDSTTVSSKPDRVILKQMVGSIPESVAAKDLPLKTNADYLNVKWLLNYPLLLLIAGVLMVALIAAWVIFGKRIKKYFRLRRLAKNHTAFLLRYRRQVEALERDNTSGLAESTLVLWKKYMEGLLAKPYTKFTTKEILRLAGDEKLGPALHYIDRMVYARAGDFSPEAFDALRAFSHIQFTRKTEEVKHG